MNKTLLLALLFLLFAGCDNSSNEPGGQTPDDAALIASDISNFWSAFDQAFDPVTPPSSRERIFQEEYLDKGSPGLTAFVERRIQSAALLSETANILREYYASIRASTMEVESENIQAAIRRSFSELEAMYPAARFVDVYFLIGRMSTGGTISEEGILIGTELFGRTADTPTEGLSDWHLQVTRSINAVPTIVAHELVHIQQSYLGQTETVLEQAIMEGSADFIGEMIAGFHINDHIHAYADVHQEEIWQSFLTDKDKTDFSEWLYNAGQSGEQPADLGYYIGYKICEAFYNQASDKQAALEAILNITDFEAFVTESGYGTVF